MAKVRSWWRRKKIYHRDAVLLSVASSACLLAGELVYQGGLPWIYASYLAPVANEPLVFLANLLLSLLAFTSVFGGILVLMGGVNFLWGKVGRGRFLLGLGVGLSALGLIRLAAYYTLTLGSPLILLSVETTSLIGIGVLTGVASDILMGEYALMLKKHARSAWKQWRDARRPKPTRRRPKNSAAGRS